MTLTREDVVAHLAPTLKAAGMRKRRYWWYWTGEEVTWAFRILKSPYGGSRLNFDLMCAPLAPGFETPATLKSDDYPLAPFLANWEIGPDVDVGMLEDMGWERLGDEERRELLTRFAHMLIDYMRTHSTAESLVRAYAAGEYRPSFIRTELQKAFDRETERLGLENKGARREPPRESSITFPDGTRYVKRGDRWVRSKKNEEKPEEPEG